MLALQRLSKPHERIGLEEVRARLSSGRPPETLGGYWSGANGTRDKLQRSDRYFARHIGDIRAVRVTGGGNSRSGAPGRSPIWPCFGRERRPTSPNKCQKRALRRRLK